jgi:hypothetical protein
MSIPNISSVFSDVCCKCVYRDVVYVSHICKYFYLDVAYVCNNYMGFQVFLQVFQMHVLSVLSVFICMLQMLHLDVFFPSTVSPQCLLLIFCCLASFSDHGGGVTKVGGGAAPRDNDADVSAYSPLLCYAG